MNKKHRGFTLLEMLFTLFVFTLIMLLLTQSLHLIQQHIKLINGDRSVEWASFKALLSKELDHYQVVDVTSTDLKLAKKDNPYDIYHVGLFQQKIYKKPGHHPYLYQVESWNLTYVAPILYIQVTFLSGQTYLCSFYIDT